MWIAQPSRRCSVQVMRTWPDRALHNVSQELVTATGCPPIDTYAFDFGRFTIVGAPGASAAPVAYCPRRTILDKLLVDAPHDPARNFAKASLLKKS